MQYMISREKTNAKTPTEHRWIYGVTDEPGDCLLQIIMIDALLWLWNPEMKSYFRAPVFVTFLEGLIGPGGLV